jgi:cytochrome c-type biogenesis protein
MFAENVPYPAALLAGLLSFFSPCVLPLIPAYFTFITGLSLQQLTEDRRANVRRKVFLSTLCYVMGFSVVFILLGASASFLGGVVQKYQDIIRTAGGIIIVILGIHLTGIFRIPGLDYEKRVHIRKKPLHLFGTFIIGMGFGAGWSPCIGPLLGAILIIAGSQETIWHGIGLLATYSLGMALPFVLLSLFINFLLVFLKKTAKALKYINVAAGVLLIVVGILLATDKLYIFNR